MPFNAPADWRSDYVIASLTFSTRLAPNLPLTDVTSSLVAWTMRDALGYFSMSSAAGDELRGIHEDGEAVAPPLMLSTNGNREIVNYLVATEPLEGGAGHQIFVVNPPFTCPDECGPDGLASGGAVNFQIGGEWDVFASIPGHWTGPRAPDTRIDLNNDRIDDILMQGASAHSVAAWVMNGAGSPASFRYVYAGDIGEWKIVGTADLNRDGIADLLMQHGSAHSVAAWVMDGAGHIASFRYIYAGDIGEWKIVGTADLNRDGIDDLLMQHASAHSVAAWLMDGAGQIASFTYVYAGDIGAWQIVGKADLNRDGIGDLLMQDASAHSVAAWLMNGAGQIASFMYVYAGDIGEWKIVGRADLNRDGIDDILMQHASAHSVAAWLMDGTGQIASFMYVYAGNIGEWRINGKD